MGTNGGKPTLTQLQLIINSSKLRFPQTQQNRKFRLVTEKWKDITFDVDEKGELNEVKPPVTTEGKAEEVKEVDENQKTSNEQEKTEVGDVTAQDAEGVKKQRPTHTDRLKKKLSAKDEEINFLKEQLTRLAMDQEKSRVAAVNTVTSQVDALEAAAKARKEMADTAYKNAFKEQDPDAALKATEEMNAAMLDLRLLAAQKKQMPPASQRPPRQQQQQQTPRMAPKAAAWLEENAEIVEDEESFEIAKAIDKNLQAQGYTPDSDEFYDKLNERLIKRGIKKGEQHNPPKQPSGGSKGSNGRQVVATQEDAIMASNLGVPLKEYMRQKQSPQENGYTRVLM